MMKRRIISSRLLSAILAGVVMHGCGSSEVSFSGNSPTVVANPDNYQSLANAPIQVAAAQGLLANDSGAGAVVASFDVTTANGGSVSVNPDGSFSYTPVFGFSGSDTFNYTISNGLGSSSAVVTLDLTRRAFFVDNTAPGGGNGSFNSRFNSLAAGLTAAGPNDTVFVFRGDGTNANLTGAFSLQAGQSLIGEGVGLSPQEGVTVVPAGSAPVLTGPGTLASSNTVRGLTFDGSANDALSLAGVAGTTIRNNTFRNYAVQAIDADNVSGSITISDNVFQANAGRIVDFDNTDLNSTIVFSNNQASANGIAAGDFVEFEFNGTCQTSLTAENNVLSVSAGGTFSEAINIDGNGASVTNVNLVNNTAVATRSDTFELDVSSTARMTVTMTGNVANNSPSGAHALEVDASGTSVLALTLTGNNFSNHGSDGVNVSVFGGGTATLVVTGNTLSGNTGRGLALVTSSTGFVRSAIRNNTFNGNGGNDLICESLETSRQDLDISGNIATLFNFIRGAASAMNIERLDGTTGGPLTAPVNTVTTVNLTGAPTPVNPGFTGL